MIKLPKLKRKQRIIRNLILISLLLFLCFIIVDFASFSPKAAFRRLEKTYISGPSDLLVIREDPSSYDTKIVLATFQDYIQVGTVYKTYHMWKGRDLFSYKSHGDITVIPYDTLGFDSAAIFVITDMKEPLRAKITIKFEYVGNNEKTVTNIFSYEGIREAEGVYFFHIENLNERPKFASERDANLEHLIETLGRIADIRTNSNESYPIRLCFYSESGELLREEEITLSTEYLYGR